MARRKPITGKTIRKLAVAHLLVAQPRFRPGQAQPDYILCHMKEDGLADLERTVYVGSNVQVAGFLEGASWKESQLQTDGGGPSDGE